MAWSLRGYKMNYNLKTLLIWLPSQNDPEWSPILKLRTNIKKSKKDL